MKGISGISIGALVLGLMSTPALAQDVPATDAKDVADQNGLAEIIVTAQRRSENLQNVPIAVTAVGGEQLEAAGVANTQQLSVLVPGLQLSVSAVSTDPFLRGVGSQILSPGAEKPIATYVDDVYYASSAGQPTSLVNVAQVAVLKGPQGTLFGRNATGGLLQITTRTPTQEPHFEFQAGYGNYDAAEVKVYASGGVAKDLAADVSFRAFRRDGLGTNIRTGSEVGDINRDISVRSKWVWNAGPDTHLTLIGDYYDLDGNPRVSRVEKGKFADYGGGYYDTNSDADPISKGKGGGVSLKAEQGLGFATLTNIVAYRESIYRNFSDPDATPTPFVLVDISSNEKQFTEELQLSSNKGSPLQWTTGLFYFHNNARFDPSDTIILGSVRSTVSIQKTESISGYAQGTWEFQPQTHLTLGARYTYEKRDFDAAITPAPPTIPTGRVVDDASYNSVTYRVALDTKISDIVLAYASVSSGFKSGGFNASNPVQAPYTPEKITSYAAGLKGDFGRGLRANVEFYYYDYKNLQINANDPTAGLPGIYNAGDATIYGLDFDASARLSNRLTLTAAAALLHARMKNTINSIQIGNPTGQAPATRGNVDGKEPPFAADFVGSLAANYRLPIFGGNLNISGTYQYNSGYSPLIDNVIEQPSFSTVNASAKWEPANSQFSIGIWVNNLTNEKVIGWANYSPFPLNSIHTVAYLPPRTYGGTIGFKF